MALGYCMSCQRLVSIQAKEQRWGSRERVWKPIEHDGPDGQPCGGVKREIK